jgi:stress-induced morphogen
MPMSAQDIERMVKAALPDAVIEIIDTAGDNDHYNMTVTSSAFAGLPRIAQHRLVHTALGDSLHSRLHALSITTKIPS